MIEITLPFEKPSLPGYHDDNIRKCYIWTCSNSFAAHMRRARANIIRRNVSAIHQKTFNNPKKERLKTRLGMSFRDVPQGYHFLCVSDKG